MFRFFRPIERTEVAALEAALKEARTRRASAAGLEDAHARARTLEDANDALLAAVEKMRARPHLRRMFLKNSNISRLRNMACINLLLKWKKGVSKKVVERY